MKYAKRKLDKKLDIKSLIFTNANLNTLMHLTTTHEHRKMFMLQRRSRVLDDEDSKGSDSLEDDKQLIL